MEQRMDATWGRGKYRTEVWEDDVNPVDFWWKAYEPSREEWEALAAGYDFNDGKKWLEVTHLCHVESLSSISDVSVPYFAHCRTLRFC
jgi:hypothetical protein